MKGMSDPLESMFYDEFCECHSWLVEELDKLNKKRKSNGRRR